MSRNRYTKAELDLVLKKGDIIQVVTPHIAGIGRIAWLNNFTLVLDPVDEETVKDILPAPPKSEEKLVEDLDFDSMPAIVPTTVIIALEDINLLFKLTPNQIDKDDK